MSLFEQPLGNDREWGRVRDAYDVTRKPRGLVQPAGVLIPFAPMEAIPQDGQYHSSYTMKSPSEIASGTYFERGDLLVAKITPSFENGKQALAMGLPAPSGVATTEVIPLHPRSNADDTRLLFFYLLHPDVRHWVSERMEGSTGRQRVPEQVLLDLPMPMFTRQDQSAIADVLELVRDAITMEREQEAVTRELKGSAMHALFTRGLRGEAQKETEIGPIPESWEMRPLLDLCEIVSGGTPRKGVEAYWGGSIPWASGKDLKAPALDDTIDHITQSGLDAASRLVPAGSVLLLVRGMGLARDLPVAVINRPMAFNQDVKALVPRGELPGQFIRSAIYTRKQDLLGRIVPSAHGTMTLNLDDVETFKVACPTDPSEVTDVVLVLDAIDRKIDVHRRKRVVLDDLFKALLHKLMTGEIRVADLDLSAIGPDATAEATG